VKYTDGTVSVLTSGQTAPTTVGTLQLADFVNEAGLQPLGQNLLSASAASGTACWLPSIGTGASGWLALPELSTIWCE